MIGTGTGTVLKKKGTGTLTNTNSLTRRFFSKEIATGNVNTCSCTVLI